MNLKPITAISNRSLEIIQDSIGFGMPRACQGASASMEVVKFLMARPKIRQSLSVTVQIIDKVYELDRKIVDTFKQNIPILFNDVCRHKIILPRQMLLSSIPLSVISSLAWLSELSGTILRQGPHACERLVSVGWGNAARSKTIYQVSCFLQTCYRG